MAERQLPKLNVAGSIPVSRSIPFRRTAMFLCAYKTSCTFITKQVIVFSPARII